MVFVCPEYYDEQQWEAMCESEQKVLIEESSAYDDDELAKNGLS